MPIPIFEQDKERKKQEKKKKLTITVLASLCLLIFGGIFFVLKFKLGSVQTILQPVEQTKEASPMTPLRCAPAQRALNQDPWLPFAFHEKLVYCDSNFKVHIKTEIDTSKVAQADRFSDGLSRVVLKSGEGTSLLSTIYVNQKGEIEIPANPEMEYSGPFSEGLACAVDKSSGKLGFINKKGKYEISPRFYVSSFTSGAQVQKADQLENCIFSSGLAPVYTEQLNASGLRESCGYINRKSKFVVPVKFVEGYPFVNERARICKKDQSKWGRRWGYIDTSGKLIMKPILMHVEDFSDGLAAVLDYTGKWGFINPDGKYVIEAKYAGAQPFSKGIAPVAIAVNSKPKWGYMKLDGSWLVEPRFDRAEGFINDEARACIGCNDADDTQGEEYSISKDGKVEKLQSKSMALIPSLKLQFPGQSKSEQDKSEQDKSHQDKFDQDKSDTKSK